MKASTILMVFTGLAVSAGAGAQQLPDPEVSAAHCRAVNWNARLVTEFPRIGEACQEVLIVEGERWIRFETELVNVNRDGSVTSNFNDRRGESMGDITIMPAADQVVIIDGRNQRFVDLTPGQLLNVYMPENSYAFAFAPRAPVAQHVRIVEIRPQPQPATSPAYVAPARVASTRTLPRTAGPLPLMAIGGVLAMLGGLGFTIRRRVTSR